MLDLKKKPRNAYNVINFLFGYALLHLLQYKHFGSYLQLTTGIVLLAKTAAESGPSYPSNNVLFHPVKNIYTCYL